MSRTRFRLSLTFKLPAEADDSHELVEALGEAGCNDALIGTGKAGQIGLDFDRDANSAAEALDSAIRDVQSAIPGIELIKVE